MFLMLSSFSFCSGLLLQLSSFNLWPPYRLFLSRSKSLLDFLTVFRLSSRLPLFCVTLGVGIFPRSITKFVFIGNILRIDKQPS